MYTTPYLVSQDLSNAGSTGAPDPSPFADYQTLIVLVLNTCNKPYHPALSVIFCEREGEQKQGGFVKV